MDLHVKARAHWFLGYGLARSALKVLAHRGDPFARLLIDSDRPENTYRLIEQIRQQGGRISTAIASAWVTADAQVVRKKVLRDDRFRTIKPIDRSPPFRIVRWLVAKTDPGMMNPVEPPSLLVVDPPVHSRLRRLVSRAFTPRATDGLQHRIHEITNTVLDDLAGQTHCDLIAAFAARIPIEVIAEMLGVPPRRDPGAPRVRRTGRQTSHHHRSRLGRLPHGVDGTARIRGLHRRTYRTAPAQRC